MDQFGYLMHEPIEPYGVPLQSMGYSLGLSLLPDFALHNDHLLRIVVSVIQATVFLFASGALARAVSGFTGLKKEYFMWPLFLFWPAAVISTETMSDSLALTLHLVLGILILKIFMKQDSFYLWFGLGVTFGLAVVIRPSSIQVSICIAALVLYALLKTKKRRLTALGVIVFLVGTAIPISPQVVWTKQQFGTYGLVKLDDSYTLGKSTFVYSQEGRAVWIQLNGCMPEVDCALVNRHPSPLADRAAYYLQPGPARWDLWLLKDPIGALAQAALVVHATLDQEFYFTYLSYPAKESDLVSLFFNAMLIIAGFVGLFTSTTHGKKLSVVATGTSLLIVPYLLTQFFLFHAENRYGLPVMAFLYMFSLIGLKRIMSAGSSRNYGRMLYVLSVVIWVTISWSLYVKPFV
jgi:4-amino-4-deoxy-L-arabinose transferase-like glycosyltransferase